LHREGKFWICSGEGWRSVDVAGLITAEREAQSEATLPGSMASPATEKTVGSEGFV
jgi:hypothetical protein